MLTGKIRFTEEVTIFTNRIKLILQVEDTFSDGPDDWRGMPTYLRGKEWRNATANDLLSLDFPSNLLKEK